jgi:cytochrome bd-type quinol oxidase subunit 2
MHEIWLAVLGVLVTGYLVGEGYALGLGLLLPALGRTDRERRTVLAALGPFFLGNEVWLVAAAGLLVFAFPEYEAALFGRVYPLVVAVLVGIVVRDMALHLRSRQADRGWRVTWDRVLVGASGWLAVSWGLLLGNLAQTGSTGLLNPYAVLAGVALPALLALHGTAFLAWRTRGTALASTAVSRGRAVWRFALPLTALIAVSTVAQPSVRAAVPTGPLPVVVLLAVGAVLAVAAVVGVALPQRHGLGFAASSLGVALPVLLAGTVQSTALLDGAAPTGALSWLALATVPVIAAHQVWLWRAFRAPVTQPAYW